jgi:hypothetical protein
MDGTARKWVLEVNACRVSADPIASKSVIMRTEPHGIEFHIRKTGGEGLLIE